MDEQQQTDLPMLECKRTVGYNDFVINEWDLKVKSRDDKHLLPLMAELIKLTKALDDAE